MDASWFEGDEDFSDGVSEEARGNDDCCSWFSNDELSSDEGQINRGSGRRETARVRLIVFDSS